VPLPYSSYLELLFSIPSLYLLVELANMMKSVGCSFKACSPLWLDAISILESLVALTLFMSWNLQGGAIHNKF
jgi:hypothetical protein